MDTRQFVIKKQHQLLNRNMRQRDTWVATRIRSPCLGYWTPKLTETFEKWKVLWTFEWATNCFFSTIITHFIWWTYNKRSVFVCLFVWVYRPTLDFSLIWRNHHCRWRAVNFHLCSAFMAIEQWGFSNASHLVWHGPTFYNWHIRGPVTLTPHAEGLLVELSLCVFTNQVCRKRGSNPDIQHTRWTLYLYATAAVNNSKYFTTPNTMILVFFIWKKLCWNFIVCMFLPY